jgi:hypothetical protein
MRALKPHASPCTSAAGVSGSVATICSSQSRNHARRAAEPCISGLSGTSAAMSACSASHYPIEHRRPEPFCNSLPEPPDQRGIGLPPVARRYERTPFVASRTRRPAGCHSEPAKFL